MKRCLSKSRIPGQFSLLIVFIFVFSCMGCNTLAPKPGETFACGQVNSSISPEAELVDFSCVVKKWDGADTLHFKVALKNIDQIDHRYKVNIFLDNGKAVGGLLPRKVKKGLVKPGKIVSFTYPVKGVAGMPGPVDLLVKTMAN
ncbi:MAG: hypothetical protein MI747_07495 [Desulfobacterales bacterium]|nr:hypothetical protein [Desulfobacterales bacterium]